MCFFFFLIHYCTLFTLLIGNFRLFYILTFKLVLLNELQNIFIKIKQNKSLNLILNEKNSEYFCNNLFCIFKNVF